MNFAQHQMDAISYLTWDHLRKSCVFPAYEPPFYSFKNRGVQMSSTPKVISYDDGKVYVQIGGTLVSRHDLETAQKLLSERDAEVERKRLEEQKKKDEIALRASKHMTKRTLHGVSWLLLDPAKVREALDRADKNNSMVSLSSCGTMTHDLVASSFGALDEPYGTYPFLPRIR